ncbi:Transketolase [Labilithrix luteola]|uniref:Transketolase n=1 Tax=Labilithrix luteola TaxID=1391654 RepID=A0A0K1PNY4_9BACT|nr:transketolase C-terminal domain-containing protein [Labilithrix luteola]AKU94829.1 Transketolase [Labilithrix luteola]
MRVQFVDAVARELSNDARSVFLTGDLGFNALEGLQNQLGPRFLNVGVAEQNMMGVAAGMALTGLRPWAYSIAPFATYRCLEQIRNDICLHQLPVRVVGNGGGYTYGIMGSTHHALEDLGALKPLPNMHLYFPCSNNHVAAAVRQMADLADPAYLRLAISGFADDRPALSEHPTTLTRRYAERPGARSRGLTIVAAGHAAQIVNRMSKPTEDAEIDIFGIARFPLDLGLDRDLRESVRATRRVLFVEEHYASGGIGESFAAAVAADVDAFSVMSAEYRKGQRYGSAAFHLNQSGLTPETVTNAARAMLG